MSCAPLAALPRTGAPAAASAAAAAGSAGAVPAATLVPVQGGCIQALGERALESPACLADQWLGVPTEHFGTLSLGLMRYLGKVAREEDDQVFFRLVIDGQEHSASRATVREWLLPDGEVANAVKGMLRKLPPEQTCAPVSDPAPAAVPAVPAAPVTTTAGRPASTPAAAVAAALSSAGGAARSHQHDAPPTGSQPGTSARFQGHLAVGKLVRAAFTDASFVSRRALGVVVSGDANRQEPLYVLCQDFAPDQGTGVYKFNVTPAGALKQVKPGSQGTYRVR